MCDVKALVGAFNQEKTLVGAFSTIVISSRNLREPSFEALSTTVSLLSGGRLFVSCPDSCAPSHHLHLPSALSSDAGIQPFNWCRNRQGRCQQPTPQYIFHERKILTHLWTLGQLGHKNLCRFCHKKKMKVCCRVIYLCSNWPRPGRARPKWDEWFVPWLS